MILIMSLLLEFTWHRQDFDTEALPLIEVGYIKESRPKITRHDDTYVPN